MLDSSLNEKADADTQCLSLSVSGCFLWMLLRSAVTHLFWWRLRSVNWEVGGYPTPCTLWILRLLATTRTLQNPCASLSLRRRASDGVQDWFAGAEVWLAVQGTPTWSLSLPSPTFTIPVSMVAVGLLTWRRWADQRVTRLHFLWDN